MELAVVAGIGLMGSYIVNNTNNNEIDPILQQGYTKSKDKKRVINIDDFESNNRDKMKKKVSIIEANELDDKIKYSNGYMNSNKVKMFPSEINGKVHHIYDTRSTPQIEKNYYDMAKDMREKSKVPERTNIIPPFFNQPYQNNLMNESNKITMGPVPNSELLKHTVNESFESQFNLQTADNTGNPASVGDSWKSSHRENIINLERNLATSQGFSPFDAEAINDMTYGITPKENFVHNNMQPNTSRRDYEVNESNNFEYKMEVFSGASKNWNPKRETLPFFDPEHYKQLPFKQELVTNEQRNRTYVSLVKQGERPFEPVYIAPGVNLDYNEEPSFGRHDTFRVMPKDTNDLRVQNKPKLTYAGQVAAAPKKGQKRGVTAPVIKRRPEQWRYQTVDDLAPNSSIVKGPTNPGNFIIPDNARMANNMELKGYAVAPKQVGGDERAGTVKISKRVTHVEDKLGPKAPAQIFNSNEKSFQVPINERNTTNYDQMGNARGAQTNNGAIDFNDVAKSTLRQDTGNKEFNTNTGTREKGTKTVDFNDIAKSTFRQDTGNKQFNTNTGAGVGEKGNKTVDFNDVAKSTMRQSMTENEFNTNAKSAQKQTIKYDPTDISKSTMKQTMTENQFNTNTKPNQKNPIKYDPTDIPKSTMKQTMTEKEFNTAIARLVGSYANLTDEAKGTIKQLLTKKEFNNNMGAAQKEVYANLTDEARGTIKQILSLIELNNNMGAAQKEAYANLTDEARGTIKQILSAMELNNNMGAAQREGYANLTDLTRTTGRQTLTDTEFNTFVARTMSTYSNLTDDARQTIKQILATQPLNNMIGAAQKESYSNLSDDARRTLKQLLTLQTFSSYIKQNPGSYANLSDEAKKTIKELIAVVELNTNVKTAGGEAYAELTDLARKTIKEFIATSELNNNIKSGQQSVYTNLQDDAKITQRHDLDTKKLNTNIAAAIKEAIKIDFNDLARTTHKQELLNEDYIGTMHNSSTGVQQVSFDMPMTMKDLTKAIDYVSSAYVAGGNKNDRSQMGERNMYQNVNKEIVAQGVPPTLSGPKLIPTKEYYLSMEQRTKPNYSRAQPPVIRNKINLEDRNIFRVQDVKTKPFYDERLYDDLLAQLEENPLINNIQKTTGAKVGQPLER